MWQRAVAERWEAEKGGEHLRQNVPKSYIRPMRKRGTKRVQRSRCLCLCIKLNKKPHGLHCIRVINLALPLPLPACLFPLLIPSTLSFSDVISLCRSPTGHGMREEREKDRNKHRKLSKAERSVVQ